MLSTARVIRDMERKSGEVAQILKQLSHPARLMILCHLIGTEKPVGELTELCGATQSQTSQFLASLKAEGLVSCRRDGQSVLYRIADPRIEKLLLTLKEVYC